MKHEAKVSAAVALSRSIRIESLRMVHRVNASHIGSCLSIADMLGVLYSSTLRLDPQAPAWSARDRFVLSKGHAAAALYAALALRGYFDLGDLDRFGADGSNLMAHVSHKVTGVEFSTGSLGHGLPFGVGKALAASKARAPWRVFVLLSDGELDEGSNWEAMMFAAHHKLDNLVAIVDYNKLQSLASVSHTLGLEPLAEKFRAFGWSVREVDGHDHEQMIGALETLPWQAKQPSIVLAHTIKGKGVSFMENRVEWHYKSPSAVQLEIALAELGGIADA